MKRREFLKTLLALPVLPLKLSQEEATDQLAQEKITEVIQADPTWAQGGVSLRSAWVDKPNSAWL